MVTKVQRQDSIKSECSKIEQASEITMTPALYLAQYIMANIYNHLVHMHSIHATMSV